MSPITYANVYAFLLLITGAVWGILMLQLGVAKQGVANVAMAMILAAMVMVVAGAGSEIYVDYFKDDTEENE